MKDIRLTIAGLLMVLLAFGVTAATFGTNGSSEKFEKTYSLSPGGRVSLQNVNGDLKVTTWDRNEVKIRAVKYANDEEGLAGLKIEVDTSEGMIAIHTKYPEDRDRNHGHGGAVDYELTVPKNTTMDDINLVNGKVDISGSLGSISVSTVNGMISASAVSGSCDLRTVNGSVDAVVALLRHGSSVKLESVNGGLVIHLPAKCDADVMAATTMGRITNEFGLAESHEGDRNSFVRVGAKLRGQLGGGGSSISLKTVNGSISILKGE